MAAGTHRRTWIFLFFCLSLLLSFGWFAPRPSFFLLQNSSATVSKNRLNMPGPRRTHPLQPQQSPAQEIVIDPVLVYSTFWGARLLVEALSRAQVVAPVRFSLKV
jgi:hypothetical protein